MRRTVVLAVCILLPVFFFTGAQMKSIYDKYNTENTSNVMENKEPITFTMFNASAQPEFDQFASPIAKRITELTGVTLKVEHAVGDPQQQIALLEASGQYPDLIYAMEYVDILIKSDALLKLDPWIDQYDSNIKKFYGPDLKRLRWSLEDPSIYYIGTTYHERRYNEPPGGFCLQHAVVKELGFPRIKTVKDFENAIQQYKEKYPTIDGKPTIGLSLLADDWRMWITVTGPGMDATQAPPQSGDCVILDEEGTPYSSKEHFFREEEREYYRWLNHMNDIGLLDPESFVQKYDHYMEKISSGRVLAITDDTWQFEEAERALRQKGKPERTYGRYPVVLKEGVMNTRAADIGFSPQSGIAITKDCKDPQRAIEFLDWMCTEESQVLRFWGIEGKDYFVKDGERRKTPERIHAETTDVDFFRKTGIGIYTYPFPYIADAAVDSKGTVIASYSKEDIKAKYSSIEKEVLEAYGAEVWMDLWPSPGKMDVPLWGAGWEIQAPQGSRAGEIQQRIDELQFEYVPRIILVKPSEFDQTYDAFLREMEKAGVHELEREMAKLHADRVRLWSQ